VVVMPADQHRFPGQGAASREPPQHVGRLGSADLAPDGTLQHHSQRHRFESPPRGGGREGRQVLSPALEQPRRGLLLEPSGNQE
jgi:hypothetical protein